MLQLSAQLKWRPTCSILPPSHTRTVSRRPRMGRVPATRNVNTRATADFAGQQQQQPDFREDFAERLYNVSPPSFDYKQQWYPVGFVRDWDKSVPHRFVLLGIPLVVWFQPAAAAAAAAAAASSHSSSVNSCSAAQAADGSDGCWHVFVDACPHRLVPLSEGRITSQGLLQCPYHGWVFDGQGSCQAIPQGGNLNSPRACASAFPCLVQQGLLFVKPEPLAKRPVSPARDSSSSSSRPASSSNGDLHFEMHSHTGDLALLDEVPVVAEFATEDWVVQDTWRDVPYDWSTLLENVLDASHVPFTHHKSISNRNILGDYTMTLSGEVSVSGFQGLWPTGPRAGALGPQSTWFRAPAYMQHKIDAVATRGFESMVVVYAVPTEPGRCRLINRNAFRFVGGGLVGTRVVPALMRAVPGWMIHLGTQVPLEDDQIFLHHGEVEYVKALAQGKTAARAYYLPSQADTYVTAFRRWILQFGGGGPFGPVGAATYIEKLQPRLSQQQLLDRYSQHTANCAQCQQALKQLERVEKLLSWLSCASAALTVLTAAVGVTAVAAANTGTTATVLTTTSQVAGIGSTILWKLLGVITGLAGVASASVGVAGSTIVDSATTAVAAAAGGRAMCWLAATALCLLLKAQVGKLVSKFYKGDYPPPRNTDMQ